MSTLEDLRPDDGDRIAEVLEKHEKFAAKSPDPGTAQVSIAECARMRELNETLSHGEIADRMDWSRHAVDYHIRERCDH